jgi:hypothetical protein
MAFAFGDFAMQNLTHEFAPELFKLTRKIHIPAYAGRPLVDPQAMNA